MPLRNVFRSMMKYYSYWNHERPSLQVTSPAILSKFAQDTLKLMRAREVEKNQLPRGYMVVYRTDELAIRSIFQMMRNEGLQLYCVVKDKVPIGLGVPETQAQQVHSRMKTIESIYQRRGEVAHDHDIEHFKGIYHRMYPKCPIPDTLVLKAFEAGSGRVGRSWQLDQDVKVTLVLAAIARHCYTNYDELLRRGLSWGAARRVVIPKVHKLLEEWRGRTSGGSLKAFTRRSGYFRNAPRMISDKNKEGEEAELAEFATRHPEFAHDLSQADRDDPSSLNGLLGRFRRKEELLNRVRKTPKSVKRRVLDENAAIDSLEVHAKPAQEEKAWWRRALARLQLSRDAATPRNQQSTTSGKTLIFNNDNSSALSENKVHRISTIDSAYENAQDQLQNRGFYQIKAQRLSRTPMSDSKLSLTVDQFSRELEMELGSDEDWIADKNGNRYWGVYGAAGVLIYHESKGVLMQHRAAWTDHGGTWGLLGGARCKDESAWDAALREAREEGGVPTSLLKYKDEVVSQVGGGIWSYTTIIATASQAFEPIIQDGESQAISWIPIDQIKNLPLHPGLAANWSLLMQKLSAESGEIMNRVKYSALLVNYPKDVTSAGMSTASTDLKSADVEILTYSTGRVMMVIKKTHDVGWPVDKLPRAKNIDVSRYASVFRADPLSTKPFVVRANDVFILLTRMPDFPGQGLKKGEPLLSGKVNDLLLNATL